jgi:polyisoprenoid-binding protein YceI
VGGPPFRVNITRDELSIRHLQWFKRHLGNKATGRFIYFPGAISAKWFANLEIQFWNKSGLMLVNTNRVQMPPRAQEAHVRLLEIASNENWKEYNMKYRAITFASAAFFITSLALASDTWLLDSSRSNAQLFQGSSANSELVNSGVARVTGKVKLDTNDLDASFFDLSIYPTDENWGHVLSPEGALPTGYVPDATDQTLLTFKSTRILRTGDGKLEVIGDLTLARMERTITAKPTENYAGPVYGDPVIHNETREITFLFPSVSAARASESLTPAVQQAKGVLEVVGAAHVDHEEFPELLSAIKETNWPPVVQNKDCHVPSTVGEDYSGAVCTETLIAATGDDNCHMPASVGEDYSGPQCTPATGNQTTIVIDLKFLHTVPEPSLGMLSWDSRTR